MQLNPTRAGTAPKYPKAAVKLVGKDANAFDIIGKVAAAMVPGGCATKRGRCIHHAAMVHDYDHLLRTVMGWGWCADK
jgi:hypothetical protein